MPGDEQGWVARLDADLPRALYLHIPFCVRKCSYCDFSSEPVGRETRQARAYADSLAAELSRLSAAGLLEDVTTAYVGGGTPTVLGMRLCSLVGDIRRAAPGIAELTCEANPDTLVPEVLDGLVEAGCTRLSVGVQSLDDGELVPLGRLHDAATAEDALRRAVSTGLAVSCDLMCGIPRQTPVSWQRTLSRAIATGIVHASVYPLTIEEGTPFSAAVEGGGMRRPSDDEQADLMLLAARQLESAGFSRYEVASYALPGFECRHNEAYWTGIPYLGLGTAASSMLGARGYRRLRALAPRLPEAGPRVSRVRLTCRSAHPRLSADPSVSAQSYELEMLDERQAAAEDLMLSMRMVAGAPAGLLAHARRLIGAQAVDEALARVVGSGLARWSGARLVPTHMGWLLGNELYGSLWELSEGTIETRVYEP
jgi:oxygen-independent coproporphyrinogen-3 oxidase